jgi:hypothetical protein
MRCQLGSLFARSSRYFRKNCRPPMSKRRMKDIRRRLKKLNSSKKKRKTNKRIPEE